MDSILKISRRLTGLVCVTWALVACTTTGTGGGQLLGVGVPDEPVAFNWTSTDGGMSGTISATVSGITYQGRFFQITQQTRVELLGPLWMRWRHGWYDWPYWGYPMGAPYPATQFITRYSGKVVATLEAPAGQHMRCRFHLAEPTIGMFGGGEGECQLTGGRTIRAVFSTK